MLYDQCYICYPNNIVFLCSVTSPLRGCEHEHENSMYWYRYIDFLGLDQCTNEIATTSNLIDVLRPVGSIC